MRLFSAKVPAISQECARALLTAGDIESEAPKEVEADIAAVLNQYLADEKDVNEKTKDLLEKTGRGMGEYGRVRVQIAESKGIKVGEDALDYVLDQIVAAFQYSAHVEEIFAEDVEMRRKMRLVFRKHLVSEADLEEEVRAQMKHVQPGTPLWDIEHARILEQVKRKKGLA
jgi:uncharacterized protein